MRRVVVTGIGIASSLGIGHAATWRNLADGKQGVQRVTRFDPSGFRCQVAGEVPAFKLAEYIPKDYRKTTKLLSRDSELAVITASEAFVDAGLATSLSQPAGPLGSRFGCHIGAGMIPVDLNELTEAMSLANIDMSLDIQLWGAKAMNSLSPLWMLKYLPNMLASHITIIHGIHGSSNTITGGEASGHLAIGEAMRAIQRGSLDGAICGGIESRVNLMAFARQTLLGRLAEIQDPSEAAQGTIPGEGGGLLVLEELETAVSRGARIYAELVGFGASQDSRAARPDQLSQRGTEMALQRALSNADLCAEEVDLLIPSAAGIAAEDRAERMAIETVFGHRSAQPASLRWKSLTGSLAAGNSFEAASAAMLVEQDAQAWLQLGESSHAASILANAEAPEPPRVSVSLTGSLGGQYSALVFRQFNGN